MYSALYNYEKWEATSGINKNDPLYSTYTHKNFMECLLNSVIGIQDSVVQLVGTDLQVVHPSNWRVVYLSPLFGSILVTS